MKKSLLLFSALALSSANTLFFAQNLVPNPSFEIQDTCPLVSQIQLAPPWNSPTSGTPDLFNSTCAMQNSSGHIGIGSSGVYCYSVFPDNREYLQAPLISNLQAGTNYCVSFWVRRANFRYGTNQIGAYLTNGPTSLVSTSVLAVTPQVTNNPSNILSSTSWVRISGNFIASGGESHIIIGSFATDAQTDTLVANAANPSKISYYYVDDVNVSACGLGLNEDALASQISLYPSPSSSIVTIRNAAEMSLATCQVIDLTGKIVLDIPIDAKSEELTFNVDLLQNGSYIVKMLLGDKWVTKKMIVAH